MTESNAPRMTSNRPYLIRAIYAQETGQGMMLPREDNELEPPPAPQPPEPGEDTPKRSHLRVIK